MRSSRRDFLKTSCLALGFAGGLGFVGQALAKPGRTAPVWDGVQGDCVLTCPCCQHKSQEKMSSENLKRIYHCPICLAWLSTKKGDHCIYDSYGSVRCPAIQIRTRRSKNLPI